MMPLNATSYPFEFIGISTLSADEFQQDTLIYRFRSRKSAHEYEVHIERYREHPHTSQYILFMQAQSCTAEKSAETLGGIKSFHYLCKC